MMRNTPLFLIAMGVFFMINACNTNPKPAQDASSLTADSLPLQQLDTRVKNYEDTVTSIAVDFTINTNARDVMEIILGKLAQQNANNVRVKKYGTMMLYDHTKAAKNLAKLAENNHIVVPAQIPDKIQSHINEISRYTGAEFDRRYMILMTDIHQKDIILFEKTAKDLQDTAFKAYINKSLPILKMHLDSAKSIKNEL